MNTNKFLIGGIIGGIVYFILGWLVYGMLLADFMKNNSGSATGVMREQADMVWWALIVGQLLAGFLIAYILSKAGATNAASGAGIGFVVGLLICAGYDLTMYATSNISTLKGLGVDIVASTLMTTIVGAVVGWYMGMGKKAVAA